MDKPGWGPLGQRVTLLTDNSRQRRAEKNERRKRRHEAIMAANEQSPLLPPHFRPRYMDVDGSSDPESEYRDEEMRYAREIDRVFGTYPRRLFNLHVRSCLIECCRKDINNTKSKITSGGGGTWSQSRAVLASR